MGLESPDRISEEVNDLQNEAKPAFVGKLDLNLAVSREEAVEGYGHENEASGNKSQVDLNHQGQHGSPSLHTDVRLEEPESPCTNSRLPLKTELDLAEVSTRNIAYDQERSPSLPSSRDKHYHEEREVVSGSSNKSSSPIEVEAFSNEMRKGDSNHCLWKSPSEVDIHHQGELMEQENSDICRANSPLHDEKLKEKFSGSLHYEKTESTYEGMEAGSADHHMVKFSSPVRMQHNPDEPEKEESYHAKRAPSENEKMDLHCSDLHSPHRNPERSSSPVRPMFTSPERSPYVQQSPGQRPISPPQVVQDPMHSPRSIRQRWSPSLDRQTKDVKRTSSQGHLSPARQTSPPRRQSQHDSQSRDDSSQRHLSRSPRRHHSPSDDRRPGRSESGSPSRRKDSSACRRDNRDRSRSRSPNIRDRHRRSPRRRHSPRRRTPSGYYSRHRSPRRRPWSPPPNRNTGVGRPGNNLFVAGFSFVTTERDLERKFSRFGRVRDVRIVRDKRSGDSRGFGFLSLERDEDADAAIRALDQTEWNGRIVLVEKSKAR